MSVNTELQRLLKSMGGEPMEEDSNADLVHKLHSEFTGQALVVNFGQGGGCDKTAGEILKAIRNGSIVMFKATYDDGILMCPCVRVDYSEGGEGPYDFYVLHIDTSKTVPEFSFETYGANSIDSYPVLHIR